MEEDLEESKAHICLDFNKWRQKLALAILFSFLIAWVLG